MEFIGVHFPETSYEYDVNNVRNVVMQAGLIYPVAIGNDRRLERLRDVHMTRFYYRGQSGSYALPRLTL